MSRRRSEAGFPEDAPCLDEACPLDHCACGTHDWENEGHECDESFLRADGKLRAIDRDAASPWRVSRRSPPSVFTSAPSKFGAVGAGRLRLRRRSS